MTDRSERALEAANFATKRYRRRGSGCAIPALRGGASLRRVGGAGSLVELGAPPSALQVVVQRPVPDRGQVEAQQLPVAVGGQVGLKHDLDPGDGVLQDQDGLWRVYGRRPAQEP